MDTEEHPTRAEVESIIQRFFDHPDRQSFKDREVIKMIVNRVHQASFNGTTRETVPYEIGKTAYEYILESGGSAEEAFEYSVKIHSKSLEWLNEIKNHPYYHSAKVVREHDDHPQQKVMRSNGTMDRSALKSSETVNKQIRKLSRYKKVSDKLESLEANDIHQQAQLDKLDAEVAVSRSDIVELQDKLGAKGLSNKEKGEVLYRRGCTQKAVAEALNVSLPTVKRWWKDYD